MIDEKFGIYPKQAEQEVLVRKRHTCQLAHSVNTKLLQLCGNSLTHSPETGKRFVVPELLAIAHLVQFANTHPVLIGRNMFSHDVHSHLCQVQISTNAGSSGYSCGLQHITYDSHRQLVGIHLVAAKIGCYVHKHLVDAIHMYILGSDILQIDPIYLSTHLHVPCHSRWSRYVCHMIVGSRAIYLPHPLHHLEESGPASNAVCLQRGRHRQAYCLVGSACICHNKIGRQRVESSVDTFY